MTNEQLKIWFEQLDSGELSQESLSQLDTFALKDPTTFAALFEDRSLHQMLRLLNSPAHTEERFLDNCLERYNAEFNGQNRAKTGVTIEIKTRSISTETGIEPSYKHNRKENLALWVIGVLATASLIVVGMFVMVLQQDGPGNITKGFNNSPPSVDGTKHKGSADSQSPVIADKSNNTSLPTEDSNVKEQELPELVVKGIDEASREVFAELFESEDAEFADSIGRMVGPGTYKLLSGQAILQFDNDVAVFMLGPAELEIVSPELIRPISGKVLVDSEKSSAKKLAIVWRDASLQDLDSARVLVDVNDEGSSINLSKGQLALVRDDAQKDSVLVELNDQGLQNAFVNNTSDQLKSNPKVMIAHGAGDKYLAQIGFGEKQEEFNSPKGVDQLLRQNNPATVETENRLTSQILDFNDRLRQLRLQFENGGFSNAEKRSPIDGFLPGPFGNRNSFIPFSNAQEFEKFREELKSRIKF